MKYLFGVKTMGWLMILCFPGTMMPAKAQVDTSENKGYGFKVEVQLAATPVKNQYRSGTCWSFGTLSFIESELIRSGKGEYDLSEMFVVRHAYADKAGKYVRMHGNASMGPGGSLPDVLYVMGKYGIVTEEAYKGLVIGEDNHVHGEMDDVLKGYLDAVLKNSNRKLTPVWMEGYNALLDTYLGKCPAEFEVKGRKYTPREFGEKLEIKATDYLHLTSFIYKPYYLPSILEVPDNWNMENVWNVMLDELVEVVDNALDKGYTIAWDADVSEKGFSHRNGIAIVPETEFTETTGMERGKWEQMSQSEKDEMLYSFKSPVKEKLVTPEERQKGFDNFSTTDDHMLHIIGRARDLQGNKYYIVKNSWGTENNPYGGYVYVSESYFRMKTIAILVHKESMPKKLKSKLNL